ncbi:hypothetical protein ACG98H_09100 [Corynebacterium sp. L4756]|uniref:hypothetical protein n=1 Tax=unclassified Corynebacterium TaxID=2624378 RepID=UPI00374DCF56
MDLTECQVFVERVDVSIDFIFDEYLEDKGIQRSAQVVPDHACQIFDENDVPSESTGGKSTAKKAESETELERARRTVDEMLSK